MKRTAQRRYERLLARRDDFIASQPEVISLFASLQRHWPNLVNGLESTVIRRTNNAVETVTLLKLPTRSTRYVI